MTYTTQRYLAVAVAVLLAGLGLVQVADPAELGLSSIAVRWMGVVASMLGVLAGFLPSVRGRGSDPEFLADRVSDLSQHDRDLVIRDVGQRTSHADQRIGSGGPFILHDAQTCGQPGLFSMLLAREDGDLLNPDHIRHLDGSRFAPADTIACDACSAEITHVVAIGGGWVAKSEAQRTPAGSL